MLPKPAIRLLRLPCSHKTAAFEPRYSRASDLRFYIATPKTLIQLFRFLVFSEKLKNIYPKAPSELY